MLPPTDDDGDNNFECLESLGQLGVSSIADALTGEISHCFVPNGTVLNGATSCSVFNAIRECEANYYIETCGQADEKQYHYYTSATGYYANCDGATCYPLSRWSCPDCPECQTNDPGFVGCIVDSDVNRAKFGNDTCFFNGTLDGSTNCSVFDDLRDCLYQTAGCSNPIEKTFGLYVLCNDNGTTSCRQSGRWICCNDVTDQGCGSGVFNPQAIEIPLSSAGNPSAMVIRIPVNSDSISNLSHYTDGTIRVPNTTTQLLPPGSSASIVSINGTPPYTTGFEIKNIDISMDNISGKINVDFDALLFYCGDDYDNDSNDLFRCPPEKFNATFGGDGTCLDCGEFDTIRIGS